MIELMHIQSKLEVEKKRYNKFGDFHYRSAEDILAALKPLLLENECILTLNDELTELCGSVYIMATAKITNKEGKSIDASAYAKEPKTPKAKMDDSQTTGSASTYARKYALNALFCLDDAKDPDDPTKNEPVKPKQEVISEKRQAVYKVLLSNKTAQETVYKRYNVGVMEDLTDKQIEQQYSAWVKNGHIKEPV